MFGGEGASPVTGLGSHQLTPVLLVSPRGQTPFHRANAAVRWSGPGYSLRKVWTSISSNCFGAFSQVRVPSLALWTMEEDCDVRYRAASPNGRSLYL
jgi:hypothetical protein